MTEKTKINEHKEDKPLEKMTVKDLKEIALEIPHDHDKVAVRDMKIHQRNPGNRGRKTGEEEGPGQG